jgi:hypothetical protein
MPNRIVFEPAKSREEAVSWVKAATETIGLGFHPDTPASDYLNGQTGKPLFSASEATAFDLALEAAFSFLGDEIYEEGLTMMQSLVKGTVAMDKKTAEQLEALVGGEAWERDGAWVVSAYQEDGTIVLFTGEQVLQFADDKALDENRPMGTVNVSVPSADDLYVLVDAKGNVLYKSAELERGWLHEEDARQEARALQSRGEGKFQVVQRSEVGA